MMTAVVTYASRRRTLTLAWGSGGRAPADVRRVADISASLAGMTTDPRSRKAAQPPLVDKLPMTPEARHERAKRGNAALTKEQRSRAGKARAAALHSIESYARRVAERWPDATEEQRRAVRRELRAAGVIQ